MNIDELIESISPTSRPAKVVIALSLLVYLDVFFLQWGITQFAISLAMGYEPVITAIFSGLLVVLYWEQHRVQSRQAEILETQTSLEKAKQKPSLEIYDWDVSLLEYESKRPLSDFIVIELQVENTEGRVDDVKVTGEVYFHLPDYKYPISNTEVGFWFQRGELFEEEHNIERVDKSTDGISIPAGKSGTYYGSIPLRSGVLVGTKESDDGRVQGEVGTLDNIGEINERWPVEVSAITVSMDLIGRDVHGEEYRKEIVTTRKETDPDLTIEEILKEGHPARKPDDVLTTADVDEVPGLPDIV